MNTRYLNNSGSRWVTPGEEVTLRTKSGKEVTRKVLFWEQVGNFAACCVSYKGKKVRMFPGSLLED